MRLRFVPTITLCFNPRTRVGCDGQLVLSISQRLFVSIHAPAWGATPRPLTGFLRHKSFNPRTRVGCDRRLPRPNSLLYWFQSTHPRGVRLAVLHLPAQLVRVSIHAPAWGATAAAHARRHALCGFNPRTRVGCDIRGDKEFGGDNWFQSTHPRGVRPQAGVPEVEAQAWFQSTHPRGVRPGDRHPRDHQQPVSIHAPAWGATSCGSSLMLARLFQSTHPRGVRHSLVAGVAGLVQFQSTHPRGVRHAAGQERRPAGDGFQSTHPRGVRRQGSAFGWPA